MVAQTLQTIRSTDPRELRRALEMMDFFAGLAEVEILRSNRRKQRGTELPVLLIGGFLGSGKTTLMQQLLTGDHGIQLTAIVNDVSAINIDSRLVARSGKETLELENGCVCCSRSGELARILSDMASAEACPDVVVVETSGVADLWALAQIVSQLETCMLDGVVNVLDAANPPDAATDELMARQVSAADIVLLNKTDIATPEQIKKAEERIMHYAPRAQVIRTVECALPATAILGPLATRERRQGDQVSPAHDHFDHAFTTLGLQSENPVNRIKIENLLDNLPCSVIRAKGIIRFEETPSIVYTLQQVTMRRRIVPTDLLCGDSQLVLIGSSGAMDTKKLLEHFQGTGFNQISAVN